MPPSQRPPSRSPLGTLLALLAATCGLLTGCGGGGDDRADFETDLGEAAARHLLADAEASAMPPDAAPVCFLWGERLRPTSPEFRARFADQKRRIASGETFDAVGESKKIIDTATGDAPITILVSKIQSRAAGVMEIEGGWHYGDASHQAVYRAEKAGDGWAITEEEDRTPDAKAGQ